MTWKISVSVDRARVYAAALRNVKHGDDRAETRAMLNNAQNAIVEEIMAAGDATRYWPTREELVFVLKDQSKT
jgi:hypothetical protein